MNGLYRHSAEPAEIMIDLKEVLRYMGCGAEMPSDAVLQLAGQAADEVRRTLDCKACYRFFDISRADGVLDLGFATTTSAALGKNLKGCGKIVLFAATIGVGTDRLIQRYSSVSPGKALAVQAVGAAAIEAYCDLLARELQRQSGGYLRPRFSPGYGDFPISYQRAVFAALDCSRQAGITLTDSFMMVPNKSVTALAGIQDAPLRCAPQGCEACEKTNCEYRST